MLSKYIIPILVIPCERFHKKIKKIHKNDKIQWLLDHILYCRKCEITNNNTIVSFEKIYDCDIIYEVIHNTIEINDIFQSYISMSHHKLTNINENTMKLIKVYRKRNDYHKCYFIVGKLDSQI